jgi:hypothetical protein
VGTAFESIVPDWVMAVRIPVVTAVGECCRIYDWASVPDGSHQIEQVKK